MTTISKIIATALASAAFINPAAAAPNVRTNYQVLDNINIALKLYSQGGLNGAGTVLNVDQMTFNTADLIKTLATIGDFNYVPGDKLVAVTTYSNYVFGTSASTGLFTNTIALAAGQPIDSTVQLEATTGVTNLSFTNSSTTNGYLITNKYVYQITIDGNGLSGTNTTTNFTPYATLTNSGIFTNGTLITNVNTSSLPGALSPLADWTTVLPAGLGSGVGTNIVVTEYAPVTNIIFTNNPSPLVAVLTPKSSGTETLIPVGNWVSFTYGTVSIYSETGAGLSTSNFTAGNITSQTLYDAAGLNINAVYPTNTPSGYTNLSLQPFGFAKTTERRMNLTAGGNASEAQDALVVESKVIDATGQGYIGGTFSTNYAAGGAALDFGNYYVGTNLIYVPFGDYILNPIDVVYNGTVTLSYFTATTNITIVQP